MNNIEEKTSATPVSNTGAHRTGETYLNALVDWLQGTLKITPIVKGIFNPKKGLVAQQDIDYFHKLNQIVNAIGFDLEDATWYDSGINGYTTTLIFGEKIKLMLGGSHTHTKNHEYTAMLLLSGYACREIEQVIDWKTLITNLLELDFQPTRIDLALDDFYGKDVHGFTLKDIKRKFRLGHTVSSMRIKSASEYINYEIETGRTTGHTIYVGSPQAKQRLVIYDKLEERKKSGYEVYTDYWLRFELRFKKGKAISVLKELQDNIQNMTGIILGTMYAMIDFKRPNPKNKLKRRWETVGWWKEFINSNDKVYFKNIATQSTMQTKKDWLKTSVSKTLSELFALDPDNFEIELFEMINSKKGDLSQKELKLINDYRLEHYDTILTEEQFKEYIEEMRYRLHDQYIKKGIQE